MNTSVIEVTSGMILQLGDCRLIVEPAASSSATSNPRPHPSSNSDRVTPREWQAAEVEMQTRTNIPFEPPSAPRADRLSLVPRPRGKYHSLAGFDVEIARVVARDGALWVIVDVKGRPVVLKRVDLTWRALPRDRTAPAVGDVILHDGTQGIVAEILGEAEVGGWAVSDTRGLPLHVVRGEARHWISLGAVQLET
jgi:hypothetical protein